MFITPRYLSWYSRVWAKTYGIPTITKSKINLTKTTGLKFNFLSKSISESKVILQFAFINTILSKVFPGWSAVSLLLQISPYDQKLTLLLLAVIATFPTFAPLQILNWTKSK